MDEGVGVHRRRYARLAPASIIPIHDALLSPPGRAMYLDHICRFGGDDLTVHDLAGRGPDPDQPRLTAVTEAGSRVIQ